MSGDVAPCCDDLQCSCSQPVESMPPRLSLSHGGEVGIGTAHSRRSSFSYYHLPIDPALRLTILKLDGSSFGAPSDSEPLRFGFVVMEYVINFHFDDGQSKSVVIAKVLHTEKWKKTRYDAAP
ncbi:U11/U12 small nuclear ribonucleoprotein 25 kDa protein [Canna indica]|uniref:U11/U12 small nuclear ribonucleoprotein 25 kDa protein n=1 Tax=Canna indica TaxID=4628 RepID=A0AAQ3JRI1_9LILI|nr:U11/U12 small nuclear ribonucleoprotein 25 kDa protein [Canna indica]